jgi:hypothetical protein
MRFDEVENCFCHEMPRAGLLNSGLDSGSDRYRYLVLLEESHG